MADNPQQPDYDLQPVDYDPFVPQGDMPISPAIQSAAGDVASKVGSGMAEGMFNWFKAPGNVAKGQQPQIPGQWSDVDEAIAQANAAGQTEWGPGTAFQMVFGGVGGGHAPEDAVGIGGGRLKQPEAFHGTTKDFDKFSANPTPDEFMLDRALGPHFAKDPEVASTFVTNRVNEKDIGPKEGGRVIPVSLPEEERFLEINQPKYDWAASNPTLKPWEGRASDQSIIEQMIAKEGYQKDPDMLARYLTQARNIPQEQAAPMAEALATGKTVDLENRPMDLDQFLRNYGGRPYNNEDRARIVQLARQAWQDQGYVGLKYINTSPMEMARASDPTSYIVFDPKHVTSHTTGTVLGSGATDERLPALGMANAGPESVAGKSSDLTGLPSEDTTPNAQATVPEPLGMDLASREARARELGFDTDQEWYHGTTHDFPAFNIGKTNRENYFGQGAYFSSDPHDASINYAGMGPDLTGRVEALADRIYQDKYDPEGEFKYGTKDYNRVMDFAREDAKAELAGPHEGAVIPSYLKMKNPIDITGDNSTYLDFNPKYDKDGEFVGDSPMMKKLYKAFTDLGDKYGFDGQHAFGDVSDKLYELYDGDVKASDLDKALRNSDELADAQHPETGDLVWGQVIADIYKKLGFDGIVMDANEHFPNMDIPEGTKHAIVFQPNQVRSKFAAFDPANQRKGFLLGSGQTSEEAAPRWFSAVQNAVSNAKMDKAQPQQWLGVIKNTPGVKPEEVSWLGLDDWLKDQKGSVTKQAIQDYVNNNKVDVQEVEKGGSESLYPIAGGAGTRYGPGSGMGEPLPGGSDYRELLLTMPNIATGEMRAAGSKAADMARALRERYGERYITDAPPNELNDYERVNQEAIGEGRQNDSFRSAHWDEPNVLAHVRFDDRTIDGDKTLHMAEVQSDWHQKGRRQGYMTGEPLQWNGPQIITSDGTRQWKAVDRNNYEYRIQQTPDGKFHGYAANVRATVPEGVYTLHEAQTAADRYISARGGGTVPDAPFKTTWPELSLKRMIRYAAENGYDRLSWDTGATNADRYDLSKHVERIQYNPESGKLWGYDKHNNAILDTRAPREKLPDYVGKDVADKLLGTEPDKGWHTLEGQSLKVDAPGMAGFYDRMLPAAANKLGKKYGAQVERKEIGTIDESEFRRTLRENGYDPETAELQTILADNAGRLPDWMTPEDADAMVYGHHLEGVSPKRAPIWSLKITPALRKAAMSQGFPMFNRGGRVQSRADGGGVDLVPVDNDPFNDSAGGIDTLEWTSKIAPKGIDVSGWRPSTNVVDDRDLTPLSKLETNFGNNISNIGRWLGINRASGGRVEPNNINHEPTPKQAKANNYAHDHLSWRGLRISIENAKGSIRRGVGKDGKPWESVLFSNYGYIKGTKGKDGDSLDVHMGPHSRAPHVFVIDQIDPETKKFDEHKIMCCFGSERQAINTYKKAFSDGKGQERIGKVHGMTLERFKEWLQHGNTRAPFKFVAGQADRVRDILARHNIGDASDSHGTSG